MEEEKIVNCAYLASFLNVSERRIQQLAKEDILIKAARGKYKLMPSIKGYIKFIQGHAYGDRAIGTDLQSARARESRLRGDLLQIEIAKECKQLVSAEYFEPLLAAWAAKGRSEFVNGVNKIIADIEGEHDVVVDIEMIGKYIASALDAVGDYPKQYSADTQVNNEDGEQHGS